MITSVVCEDLKNGATAFSIAGRKIYALSRGDIDIEHK
jgi:hypothetical protein